MVNWQDPSVIAFCGFLYNQIAVFLLGFFRYAVLSTSLGLRLRPAAPSNHFLTRMDVEWSLLTRKRRFNPVLVRARCILLFPPDSLLNQVQLCSDSLSLRTILHPDYINHFVRILAFQGTR